MLRLDGPLGGLCRGLTVAVSCLAVAGCATLPASGPTGRDIRRAAAASGDPSAATLPFRVVEVASAADLPPPLVLPQSALLLPPIAPTDLIGPGDVLNITIFEAGVSLFGRTATRLGATGTRPTAAAESASAQSLPGVRVDDQGYIRMPFVGRLRAAGSTPAELQARIRSGLLGKSQDPQVLVAVDDSLTNSVVLAGELNRPGRFVLRTNRETVNDTVALAGGYKGDAKDLIARVERGGESFQVRLSDLLDTPQADLRVAPGDRITLISRPQSFSIMGAPNRSEQVRFPRGRVTLSEAVALGGGANPNQGDAAAVFVFRYVPGQRGAEEPVVYHFNMMKPGAMFLSQRFAMNDQDLLYIGNAQANQPTKLIQLISQLFVPVTTLRTTIIQ